ncbi:RNA-binding protein [Prunus dulcis]|uniref:RNA-binding protein n=1 Tax=Prunus dulcis TaxID=3755 RepID=A0A4Y1RE25_PRUDU|nr:RNA-binding protein [Prunus dulcis]
MEQHMIHIKTAYPKFRKRTKWLQDKHNSTFIQWLRFKVQSELEEDNHGVSENLRWLAAGPNMAVPLYRSYLIKVDELGFTLVDLSKIGHRNDQFVLASQVKQIFFVDDPMHRGWSVVLSMPNREYNDVIGDEVLGDVIIECEPFTRGMPNVDTFDELVLATKQSVQKILVPDYIIIFCIKNDVCSNKTRHVVNQLFSIFTDVLKQRNNEEPRRYCEAIIQDITSGKD